MNYKNIHERIIEKAQREGRKRNADTYYESHHIIPRCLGGSNNKKNLVLLTFREHFIVHWLFCKIYKNDINALYKLSTAFVRMASVNEFQRRFVSARKYSIAKNIERKAKQGHAVGGALIINRSDTWKNNISKALRGGVRANKGKTYAEIYSPEVLDNVMASRRVSKNKCMVWVNNGTDTCRVIPVTGIPEGWVYGRIKLASAKKWYNNGLIEKLVSNDSEITTNNNWNKGRLNAKNKKDM